MGIKATQAFYRFKKNPGHLEFMPIKEFNIRNLPNDYQENDIVDFVKAVADLTIRVAVNMTGPERPNVWTDNNYPYPFHYMCGSDSMRLGSAIVYKVILSKLSKCPCLKCEISDTPSEKWGEIC